MDEIAPEYDVVVLGTGVLSNPALREGHVRARELTSTSGLTECVLSGYEITEISR
jgi:hypothetical protein